MTVAASDTNRFSWGRIWELFRAHTGTVALVVGLVVATSVLGVINPLLIQRMFDDALFPQGGPDIPLLVTLTIVMVVITMLTAGLGVVQTKMTNDLGQSVLRDLRDRVYTHLQSLSLSFYASTRTGELQSRITNDVGGVQTAVTTTLSSILSNLVSVAAALVAMFILSWQLTLLSLASVPFFVIATRWVGRRRRALTGETQRAVAEMNVITQETLSVSGFVLTRLFGRSDYETGRFEDANTRLADVSARRQVIGAAFFTVIQSFLGVVPVIVYLVAGLMLSGGIAISAGTIVAFTTLQGRVFFPVARMLETWVELKSSEAMFERIFEYLDTEPEVTEIAQALEVDTPDVRGRLRFDRVSFRYDQDGPLVLHDIEVEAEPGSLVAFVGRSGAGKSTLLSLVPRLYDPTEGSVLMDDHDVSHLSFASIARLVGMVTQESYLFADTLAANISYGHPDATKGEIEKAARAAAIHDRIMEFEEGYDTSVGERGFRLSGGERQRIAIARVLLANPRYLVLDEATSSLDSTSERLIQSALAELMSGRTTLAVAHRLSTIQAADVIHVLDDGRIAESGTHEELLARDGIYRELYRTQFDDGAIETRCAEGVVYADGHVQDGEHHQTCRERGESLRKRRRVANKRLT